MKTLVLTICSPEYAPLGDVTLPHWQAYCDRHGYEFRRSGVPAEGAAWGKLYLIMRALFEENFDRVLWVGTDTLPTNPEYSLDYWMERYNFPDALIAADIAGLQSDVMIFNRTNVIQEYLYAAAVFGQRLHSNHGFAEQEALSYFAYRLPYLGHIKIIPQKDWTGSGFLPGFQCYINEIHGRPREFSGRWAPGDWILHLPHTVIDLRIAIFRQFLETGDVDLGNLRV